MHFVRVLRDMASADACPAVFGDKQMTAFAITVIDTISPSLSLRLKIRSPCGSAAAQWELNRGLDLRRQKAPQTPVFRYPLTRARPMQNWISPIAP